MKKADRKRIFEIIQIGNDTDFPSRSFDFLIMTAIIVNIFIAIFSTFEISEKYKVILDIAEICTVLFFTLEYILRVWTSDYLYPGIPRWKAALKYIFSAGAIVDFLSFFPFYLPFFIPDGIVAFRIFRIVRILRLFRINIYYDALNLITDVLKRKKNQLLSSVFIVLVLMIASSLLMYNIEHKAQPDVFQNAFSGFWWSVSTLLTVGYGDIYPVTIIGKLCGIVITFLGVGMVAIPTGILSAGFVEQVSIIQKQETAKKNTSKSLTRKYCPYCGEKLI